jgi:protein-disulfide isomerase
MRTTWRATLVLPVSEARDHIRGPMDAPVTLVEYGDYQCPFCGQAHPIVQALLAQAGDSLRFVFRHFPLHTMHPYAEQAAEAAEAAGAQDQVWQMHDTLYENQDALDFQSLISYASDLGLDVQRFSDDLLGRAYARKVAEDLMSGVRSGVGGTPTFFINGVRHDGSWDLPTLTAAVQRAAGRSAKATA